MRGQCAQITKIRFLCLHLVHSYGRYARPECADNQNSISLFTSGTLVRQVLEEGRLSTCKLYCIYNKYIECYSVRTSYSRDLDPYLNIFGSCGNTYCGSRSTKRQKSAKSLTILSLIKFCTIKKNITVNRLFLYVKEALLTISRTLIEFRIHIIIFIAFRSAFFQILESQQKWILDLSACIEGQY